MAATKIDENFILSKLEDIPSLPAVVYELGKVINDPMSSTNDVEKIMSQDIGLTTKLLKLVNSAYYAIPGGVADLSRAIAFIGFDTIQQLVLSASIIKSLDSRGSPEFNVLEFWKHSIACGIVAETIAKYLKKTNTGDYFTAGLIHDIGKIALYILDAEKLHQILLHAEKNKITFIEAEKSFTDINHCEISKILGEKWRLPKVMLASCRYHHEKSLTNRGALSNELNQVVDIIFLSNLLVHALKVGYSGHSVVVNAPNEILQRLMIDPKTDMPNLLRHIKQNLDKSSGFIQTIVGGL